MVINGVGVDPATVNGPVTGWNSRDVEETQGDQTAIWTNRGAFPRPYWVELGGFAPQKASRIA